MCAFYDKLFSETRYCAALLKACCRPEAGEGDVGVVNANYFSHTPNLVISSDLVIWFIFLENELKGDTLFLLQTWLEFYSIQ